MRNDRRLLGALLGAAGLAVLAAACTTGTRGGGRLATSTPTPSATATNTATNTPPALGLAAPAARSRQQRIAPFTGQTQQVYLRVQVSNTWGVLPSSQVTATGPSGTVAIRTPVPGLTPSALTGGLENVLGFPSAAVQAGDAYVFSGSTQSSPPYTFPTTVASIPAVVPFPTFTAPTGAASGTCFGPVPISSPYTLDWDPIPGVTFYSILLAPMTNCVPGTPGSPVIVPFFQSSANLSLTPGTDYLVTFIASDMTTLGDPLRDGDSSTYLFWLAAN